MRPQSLRDSIPMLRPTLQYLQNQHVKRPLQQFNPVLIRCFFWHDVTFAIFASCRFAKEGSVGLHRLQGRKPAFSASSQVPWNCTFSGLARRAAHDGRQYTPVVFTE
jgi:hypothetical protein